MFRTVLTSLLAVLVLCGSAFAAEKTLIAAANPTWPPMEFLDENKNIIGYDRDIIAAIAEEIGMKSEFRNIAWDGIFASLESGQANVIASCVTITDKRKKAYVFSDPYYEVHQAVVVAKDSAIKKPEDLKGKKVGAKMKVDINELYKNPAQRAAALQLKENELAEVKPEFSLEITKIRKFADPELNEEFFKTAFPQGNVTDEAGLDAFVDTEIGKELSRESDYLFTLQLRDFLLKKADLKMPAAFLKRWLYVINEEKFSKEEIEKDFDQFLKMFSWNYIQKHFIKEDNLTVTADEALAEAKAFAAAQFAQYGMPAAPDEMLENFAKQQILANKEQSQKIYEKLYETKVVEDVKGKIKVTEKAVSADEFAKLAKEI